MAILEIETKMLTVLLYLYKRKDDGLFTGDEILIDLNGKISIVEFKAIMQELVSKNLILEHDVNFEGTVLNIIQYSLSLKGLSLCEEALAQKEKKTEPQISGIIQENTSKNQAENNKFSQRQIAIAYCILNIPITTENAENILSKYSETKCVGKLLTKRVYKIGDLTKLSSNKTTDTKHLNDLKAAKRLISGRKNKNAITDISRIITAFETAYNSHY
jgi:hypothetical protein